MRRWIELAATAACGLAAGTAGAVGAGSFLWERRTARAVRQLGAPPLRSGAERTGAGPHRERLAQLPDPVARYFAFALAPDQPLIRRARLRQKGVLRSGVGAPWNTFEAVEHFATQPVGFVWDARARVAPFVFVRIRDSYLHGEGASEARLASLIALGRQRATPETTAASLIRYLAEAPWLPTALLPGEGLTWAAVDERNARATLNDGAMTVSVDVGFGTRGEIAHVSAMRYRDVRGAPVLTPWTGRFRDYAPIRGMMIPLSAEVEWIPPEGAIAVWCGSVVAAEFEFAP